MGEAKSCQLDGVLRIKRIRVVAVRGRCNAGLEVGDSFVLDGWRLISDNAAKLCCVALASIIANASRSKLRKGGVYVSCPDPATGEGGNVIFELCPQEDHDSNQH